MTNPIRKGKKYIVVTCRKCGKLTDITFSDAWQSMIVQNKTLKEEVERYRSDAHKLRVSKNGQIQALHNNIRQLYLLLTPDQKNKAYKLTQQLRDELKRAEKQSKE